ncbi:unnamed protein product [Kuraishia capsulata CBS 1993]|uniref:AB hydrolase-1 domain-containing protein n=1 Tax=Kuraishia capsulata CBS 1993 TaxID=1382522 RepID=W6MI26_9ASCO|nr:uncharacterized protein KUCA_T00002010001 [Kuraishia capsulata CBS 1993]CDK26039.1 unnamed protein product [Kuraishia capsulata CBS 1993]
MSTNPSTASSTVGYDGQGHSPYGSADGEDVVESNIEEPQSYSPKRTNEPLSTQDPERRPLLSPDDPSVSPLNVRRVRISRGVITLSTVVSALWFILLLVSDFVSIPGFNNRGRSFFELDLIFLSLIANFTALTFFTVPSPFERTVGYVTSGFIAFVLFLILVVPYLRHQHGMVGFLTVLWVSATMAFGCLADYFVELAKTSEEIRLTGRPETRRTLFEYTAISVRFVLRVVVLILAFFLWLNVLFSAFDSRIKPWGKTVSVANDSLDLHLYCVGDVYGNSTNEEKRSQPTVLLESGQYTSVEEFSKWVEELYHLNKIQKYCLYDHPGMGFSDSAPSPISIGIITDMLHEALTKEKIYGPFTLVGFDMGGLYSRVFASRHMDQVDSVLLVDSWPADLLKGNPLGNTAKGERKDENFKKTLGIRPMSSRTGLALWLEGVVAPFSLRNFKRMLLHRDGSNSRIWGDSMRYQSKFIRAKLQEQITSNILSYNEVVNADEQLHKVPLSVVTSNTMIKNSPNWGRWQRELTKLGTGAVEWLIADGDHKIWENPKGVKDLQDILRGIVTGETVIPLEAENTTDLVQNTP